MNRRLIFVVVFVVILAGALVFLLRRPPAAVPDLPAIPADVASQDGLFRLSYRPDPGAIPLNTLHAWTLHLTAADGRPLEGAQISVDGRMPAHGHGLPTQPQVTADLGGGDYRVEGLRFQMNGEWQVDFTIQAGGLSDIASVTFTLR